MATQELDLTFKKTLRNIEKTVIEMSNRLNSNDISVVELDKAIVVQYLDSWNNFNNSYFFKRFNVTDSILEKVTIFFIPKGEKITITPELYKTALCLDGKIELDGGIVFDSLVGSDLNETTNVFAHKDSFILLVK